MKPELLFIREKAPGTENLVCDFHKDKKCDLEKRLDMKKLPDTILTGRQAGRI